MRSSKQTGAYISSPVCTNRLIFSKRAFFYLVLSEYANQSHNFTKFEFLWRHTSLLYWLKKVWMEVLKGFNIQTEAAIYFAYTSVNYLIEQIARFDFLQDPFFNFWHLFCLSVRIGVKSQCFVRTTDGICCVFPFQYRGIEYTNCATSEGKSPKMHWCATQAGFDETRNGTGWGYCAGE